MTFSPREQFERLIGGGGIYVINCYDPTAFDPYEDAVFTGRRSVAKDTVKLRDECINAALTGVRHIMWHTVVGGTSGHHISCDLDGVPVEWWASAGDLIREMREGGVEIIIHFGHRFTGLKRTTAGPPDADADQWPTMFSKYSRASSQKRDAIKAILAAAGVQVISGDNWMHASTRDWAVNLATELHAENGIEVLMEATPFNDDGSLHPLASAWPTWTPATTLLKRPGVLDERGWPAPINSFAPEAAGLLHTYVWSINQQPWAGTVMQHMSDATRVAMFARAGWIVMTNDIGALLDGYERVGLDVASGMPIHRAPRPTLGPDRPSTESIDARLKRLEAEVDAIRRGEAGDR